MTEIDRDLGRVEGKIDILISRIETLEAEVKDAVNFKWQVLGIATGVSAAISFLTKFL